MKARFLAFCLGAACTLPAPAQSDIRGPIGGFVVDSRISAIRPVNGMPGAATLGAALAVPFAIRTAAISAARDFALAVSADDGELYVLRRLASGAPSCSVVEGAAGATQVILSATGASALVYAKDAARLQVIGGLPDNPAVRSTFDTSGVGDIAAAALSEDGGRVVAATTGEGAVYEFTTDGPARLAAANGASAIALRDGGREVLVANQATNEIALIREGAVSILAGEADGVNRPVAVTSVNAGREVWIANAGSSSVLAMDMEQPGTNYTLPLAGVPTRCDPLDGVSTLVLNDAGSGPLLLADWAREHATYFVPADAAGDQ